MIDALSIPALAEERRPLRAVGIIVLDWMVILGAIALVARYPSIPAFILAFVLISIEQHALGLWMHESAHWLLARSKKTNDLISTLLLAGPLYVPLHAYRSRHFTHHGYLGTETDTKQVIFTRINGWRLVHFFVMNALGLQFVRIAIGYTHGSGRPGGSATSVVRDLIGIAIAQALVLGIITLIAPWHFYLWFWFLPWLTLNRFIAGLRSIIEHQPLAGEQHPFTRTFRPTLLDRFVFSRVGFAQHWTHHRYPTVPCFNLPRIDVAAEQPVAARTGYFATLRRLILQP